MSSAGRHRACAGHFSSVDFAEALVLSPEGRGCLGFCLDKVKEGSTGNTVRIAGVMV
jgi:hypothetical protein